MNCPDCRGQVELEKHYVYHSDPDDDEGELESPIYCCPKCRANFDPEDLED